MGGERGSKRRHRVVGLCLDGMVAFDLTAPAQAFGLAAAADGSPHYAFSTCSVDGGPVRTTSGFAIAPEAGLRALASAGTVVVPGYAGILAPPPEPALAALRRAAARGARAHLRAASGALLARGARVFDGRRGARHVTQRGPGCVARV